MDYRFPVGPSPRPETTTAGERAAWIGEIEQAPARFREAVAGLTAAQLDTPYREGGWTVRQVVHHAADSHMHASIRTRFTLTLAEPTIQPYDEGPWAELVDARTADVELSLALLEGLHARWALLWRSLGEADWQRRFLHPENGWTRLDQQLALYAWHSRHHAAHITALRARRGW